MQYQNGFVIVWFGLVQVKLDVINVDEFVSRWVFGFDFGLDGMGNGEVDCQGQQEVISQDGCQYYLKCLFGQCGCELVVSFYCWFESWVDGQGFFIGFKGGILFFGLFQDVAD